MGTLTESEITSSQAIRLLVFLLSSHHRKVSQRELADILWPASEVVSPKKQVQNAVYRTRKLLSSIFSCEFISSDRSGNYFINPVFNLITDVDAFEYYYTHGIQFDISMDRKKSFLLEAIQLYKNDLLPNLIGNNWLDNQRTYYHLQYLQAVLNLMPLLYQDHAYAKFDYSSSSFQLTLYENDKAYRNGLL